MKKDTTMENKSFKNNTIMKHFKPNVDTKQNIVAAKKAAFADIKEYYHSQDKPVIWCSIRQLNEYFRNLECS